MPLHQAKWQQIAVVYENQVLPRSAPLAQANDEQLATLKRYLPAGLNERILDAGCGNGKYARTLTQLGFRQVHSIDLFENLNDCPLYRQASVTDSGYPDQWFSLVYSLSVIFYLDDPREAIREYHRILVPGGRLILSCHSRYSLWTLSRVLKRALHWPGQEHLRHIQFLPVWTYLQMLRETGFEIEEVDGFRVSYLMFFLSALRRRLAPSKTATVNRVRNASPRRPYLWGYLRSLVGYHAIIVCRKPLAPTVEQLS